MQTFEHLKHLFGAYFHQDWGLEAPDWQGIVRTFKNESFETEIASTVRELEVLLQLNKSESDLEQALLQDFGCYYTPRPDLNGPSFRQWISALRSELQAQSGPTSGSTGSARKSAHTG